jgi:hypothetical protein
MPANFPPTSVYPQAIDTDRTLYKVFNTTESVITADNQAWSETIDIKPVTSTSDEIWADNGFATISGELLYYDSVETNAFGKVNRLTNCIRNLGGSVTRFNPNGTDIRSFVIAEHHNQIVDAICKIEKFIGGDVCGNTDNLVCCIDELDVPDCIDDGNCPDVAFDFSITANDPCEGVSISYIIDIAGTFDVFRLDFGDGTFTTVPENGVKQYSPGATVDPVVTVSNSSCEVVITGVQRTNEEEPEPTTPDAAIIIPIPQFNIPTIELFPIIPIEPDISIPPIVTPCIDLEPIDISIGPIGPIDISINVPSVISIIPPDLSPISIIPPNIPNPISIIPPEFPTSISIIPPDIPDPITFIPPSIPDPITFIPPSIPNPITFVPPDIPTNITFTPPIMPSVITFIPPTIPTTITVTGCQIPQVISVAPSTISLICCDIPSTISITADNIPPISVNWGTPPDLSCTVTVVCPAAGSGSGSGAFWANDFPNAANTPVTPSSILRDLTESNEFDGIPLANIGVEYDFQGIPSVIDVLPPDIAPIKIEHNIPSKIAVEVPDIPTQIEVTGMHELKDINVMFPDKMPSLGIDVSALPTSLSIDASGIPNEININMPEIPSSINIEHDIPSVIQIEGMPHTVMIDGFPDHIGLKIDNPEDLVFRVEPAEVKITLDIDKLITNEEGGNHCFALVPCKP